VVGRVVLVSAQPEKEKERQKREEKGEGEVSPLMVLTLEKREKDGEGKREAEVKERGQCKGVACAKILKKCKCTSIGEKEREGWCNGGGDGATLSGGVSTRKKRGKCPPSTLGIVRNKR
jgi:hypothetical protein